MASSAAPLPKTAAASSPASHNASIDANGKPTSAGKLSSSFSSPPPPPSASFAFRPPRPALKDKVRSYLLSTHFQCAVQLTVGVAFLSLFVLVEKLRFPMSCQAAVIYGTSSVFSSSSNLSTTNETNSHLFSPPAPCFLFF